MVIVAKNKSELKKRINRFFNMKSDKRQNLTDFIDLLSQVTNIYVFGGAIRDIALNGILSFYSDLDIVFEDNEYEVDILLREYNPVKNKFGGYRLDIDGWPVDIWKSKNSWAFSEGYLEYKSIDSLLLTTITNWDSILYDWNSNEIICRSSYFKDLESGYLDIEFTENLNKLGMAVRIIKCYAYKNAHTISPKLARLLNDLISTYTLKQLQEYEFESYGEIHITKVIYTHLKENNFINEPDLLPIRLKQFYSTKDLIFK